MATANLSAFLGRLTRGMAAQTLEGCSDRELVEKALAGRDEAAFQAIVQRHGPMVYRVCWRLLQHPQDAEDAFQATFLVLAQNLRTLRKRASLASWLHGVARRVALKSKTQAAARRRREQQAARPDTLPQDGMTWGELRSALESELSQLPEKWRSPLILCYLEGRTQDEAARQLGWSKATLRRRLEQARATLGSRLKARGLTVPAALSALLLSDCLASAAPAPGLVASTVETAARVAAGQAVATVAPTRVAALVLKTMSPTRLKIIMAALVGAGLLIAGAVIPLRATGARGQAAVGKPDGPGPAARAPEKAQVARRWKERLVVKAPADEQWTYAGAVSPDGKTLAVGYERATKILDAKTGLELATLPVKGPHLAALAFSPDGKLIAQRTDGGEVVLCSADSGQIKARLGVGAGTPSVAFSPDGKMLATASYDTVRLWDLATNQVIREFGQRLKLALGAPVRAYSVVFSPDGKKLATAELKDRAAKVWDVATGQELASFGHTNWVIAVAFSPDGKTLAAICGAEEVVTLWDLATGKARATLKGPTAAFNQALAFSPDGKVLAVAGSFDTNGKLLGVVQLWDPATGEQLAALKAHQVSIDRRDNTLRAVSFSRDGTLVTVGDDAVRVWEAEKRPARNNK